ncbi:MAG: UDP-N-acetylglucosamine 1-carboxyvinyltransferase, partial [bacterium]|nr:UDP-N-acetylglucosamine 1-carboxyvinyltransferase [bacterium]
MPESSFIIKGGRPLKGKVRISGAKNAAIKEIAASLLTKEPLILENVPRISDVEVDLKIVEALGVAVEKSGGTVTLHSSPNLQTSIPEELSKRSRASVITLGPLLAREGRVV